MGKQQEKCNRYKHVSVSSPASLQENEGGHETVAGPPPLPGYFYGTARPGVLVPLNAKWGDEGGLYDNAVTLRASWDYEPAAYPGNSDDLPTLDPGRWQASIGTGSCALCGRTDFSPALAVHHGHYPRFCLCEECHRCCYVCFDPDGLSQALFIIRGPKYYDTLDTIAIPKPEHFEVGLCPGCKRVVVVITEPIPWNYKNHQRIYPRRIPTACCQGHQAPAKPASLDDRSVKNRQDRPCEHCGATFTPKNSLAKTCSMKCRVAMHRREQTDKTAARLTRPRKQ